MANINKRESTEEPATVAKKSCPAVDSIGSSGVDLKNILETMTPENIAKLGKMLESLNSIVPVKPEYVQPDDNISYCRQYHFYEHDDAHHLNNLDVRKFWNEETGTFHIHWSKKNVSRNGKALGNSHQEVSAVALGQLIEKLKKILTEIGSVSYKDVLPRFAGNPYAGIIDRNIRDFWHPTLVDTLENSELILRPFKDFKGHWTIKVLHPVFSSESPNWTGIICNFDIKACQEFINVLEMIQKEIDVDDEERVAAVRQA